MNGTSSEPLPHDVDGLRVYALGRIPRCARCARYEALRDRRVGPLPEVPAACSYQVCSALAEHHEKNRFRRLALVQGAGRT